EIKVRLHEELKRLGVDIYDRVMATSLLTEGGRQGARVVGATGVNVRTGEFYIFKAKSTILTTGSPSGMWVFSTEMVGAAHNYGDPNNAGDGCVMAWNAGAECTLMERSGPAMMGPFAYPRYGIGNAGNTWYACTMVDSNGKEIPWVDRDGNVLKTVSERYRPAPGQRMVLSGPPNLPYEVRGARLTPELPDLIRKGEVVLPLYADLPGMPEHERRAIFGLMVGHEGKTRIAIYENYTNAGFDPDKDMLMAHGGFGTGLTKMAAGTQTAFGGDHAQAATTGRYSARKAFEFAQTAGKPDIARSQVEREKERVYAPVNRKGDMGWKELQAGICRIMQDYCGEFKSEKTLEIGLKWLESIRVSEAERTVARNPHELMRTLDCLVRIGVGEMIMHASLARKASSDLLDFKRIDYPDGSSRLMPPPMLRTMRSTVRLNDLLFFCWQLQNE
ncbi:MAG: FAD-binding protein, partial [Deltaproteobacteria bacterium]|nr:FAD-binding protein [Deltaproteobacteria bacterium]